MSGWLSTLDEWRARDDAVMLLRVIATEGSVPREVGAQMLISADDQFASIGGGHLEWVAIREARQRLADGRPAEDLRFPLGARLGQCCGGVVWVRMQPLISEADWQAAQPEVTHDRRLTLFGAGHVGRALVTLLDGLDIRLRWIDSREEMLPEHPPAWIEAIYTDCPEAEVAAARPGECFLIMTHAHSLDLELCDAVLRRGDFAFCGLIGSQPKLRRFRSRLAERGLNPAQIERLTCPIGIAGIPGKQPAEIAISVAAQLLQIYHQQNGVAIAEKPKTLRHG